MSKTEETYQMQYYGFVNTPDTGARWWHEQADAFNGYARMVVTGVDVNAGTITVTTNYAQEAHKLARMERDRVDGMQEAIDSLHVANSRLLGDLNDAKRELAAARKREIERGLMPEQRGLLAKLQKQIVDRASNPELTDADRLAFYKLAQREHSDVARLSEREQVRASVMWSAELRAKVAKAKAEEQERERLQVVVDWDWYYDE